MFIWSMTCIFQIPPNFPVPDTGSQKTDRITSFLVRQAEEIGKSRAWHGNQIFPVR